MTENLLCFIIVRDFSSIFIPGNKNFANYDFYLYLGLENCVEGVWMHMGQFGVYKKELSAFEQRKSKYEWDELEELITDDFEEGKLTSEEFDELMRRLMELDCG